MGAKLDLSICNLCLKPVTNPLCTSCLSLNVNAWIKEESDELFKKFSEKSANFFSLISETSDNVEFCTRCRDYTFKVECPYCYIHSVFRIIEKINWVKAAKFKIAFDNDFEKSGFSACTECKDDVIRINNAESHEFIESSDSIIDMCGSCGSAGYFSEMSKGEVYCDNCLG